MQEGLFSDSETVIRGYQTGDDELIVDLSQRCFKDPIDIETWRWKYFSNPWGWVSTLGIHGQRVVSHYGSYLLRAQFNGAPFKIAVGADAMSDLRTAPRLAYSSTVKGHLNALSDLKDIAYEYGFPANRTIKLAQRISNFGFYERVTLWSLRPKSRKKYFSIGRSVNLDQTDVLPCEIDELWNSYSCKIPLSTIKDSAYFKWRYLSRPNRDYKFISVRSGESILALFVLYFVGDKIFVLEHLFKDLHEKLLARSLEAIATKFKASGSNSIILTQPKSPTVRQELLNLFEKESWLSGFCEAYEILIPSSHSTYMVQNGMDYTLGDYDMY